MNQSTGQESSNTNNSESSIKINEWLDKDGKAVSRTTTTFAKTGSETNQQTDMLAKMEQKLEQQEKKRTESEANSKVNLTYIIIGIIALILISGGSRLIALYKKVKPL